MPATPDLSRENEAASMPATLDLSREGEAESVSYEEIDRENLIFIKLAIPTYASPHFAVTRLTYMLADNHFFRVAGCKKTFVVWADFLRGSLIHNLRNQLIAPELNCEDGRWYDYILFADSDVDWHDNRAIAILASYDLPVVGATVVRKSEPFNPTMFMRDPTTGCLATPVWNPYTYKKLIETGQHILRVDAIGTGFTMIRRDVVEAIPRPWFWNDTVEQRGAAGEVTPQALGEDVYFCEKVNQAGFKIYADLKMNPAHIGDYGYTLGDYFAANMQRAEEIARQTGKDLNESMKFETFTMETPDGQVRLPDSREKPAEAAA